MDTDYPPNIYYNPEAFDLAPVTEINLGDGYEQSYIVLWRHISGTLYVGIWSGCSCPSPFEEVTFEELTIMSESEMQTMEHIVGNETSPRGKLTATEAQDFLVRVREAWKPGSPI